MSPTWFQQFFSQRVVGWLSLIGGLVHVIVVLLFVALVEGWQQDFRIDSLAPWVVLAVISSMLCLLLVTAAVDWSKYIAERPWYSRAQEAEKLIEDLKDQVRELREAKRNLTDANEALKSANETLRIANEAQAQTERSQRQRLEFVEPRLNAAEEWLRSQAQMQVVTSYPGNFAEVRSIPTSS